MQDKAFDAALVWFRRDLRTDDQAALYHALRTARRVWCAFVFDTAILDALPRADRRVEFIRDSLVDLDAQLRALGAAHGVEGTGLIVRHGKAQEAITQLADELNVQAVFANHDDDPSSLERDATVLGALAERGVVLRTFKDHVVFERTEVMTRAGTPFTVFTPYRNAWLRTLTPYHLTAYPVSRHAAALAPLPVEEPRIVPTLESLGFQQTNLHELKLPSGSAGAAELLADFLERIDDYHETRDFPGVKGPSYLGPHLRFGTVSIRLLAREAHARMVGGSRGAEVWLSELVWREFFQQLLHHHPRVVEQAFKSGYEAIRWEHGKHAEAMFAAWCEGRTGYPIIDAAMRQLNQTGYMHNRLRMLTASFLVKHLGIEWRRGEAYFALKLNDYEIGSNNGGWQWAASTGCDAQPYVRIFNPVTQSRRYDPNGRFIRRYVPEIRSLPDGALHAPWLTGDGELQAAGIVIGRDYCAPVVDHSSARYRPRPL
jgi:deoxyribodipyrimidine photo-lyase